MLPISAYLASGSLNNNFCGLVKVSEPPCVEELLVLVLHPHLDDSLVVDGDDRTLGLLGQVTEAVGHEGSVDVTNSRTRHPHCIMMVM